MALIASLRRAVDGVRALRGSLGGVSRAATQSASALSGRTITFVPGSFDVEIDLGGARPAPINTPLIGQPNVMAPMNRPRLGGGVNVQARRNTQARGNAPRIR
jgi:hypothetical protein